ncbi:MAG: glycosyltransferase [Candidatus Omnitrophica bacterium]|nr:glycosyltransferase [Candidatus Omnitrophota bacterium]
MKYKIPKISVVTISYNHVNFIEDAIKSVIFQKGDFYLEYIIIDGGSTDGSLDIIKKYYYLLSTKKIPIQCFGIDYKYISEKDNGPTFALNKGLKMVTGEIIGILNSDDIYVEGTFQHVIKAFQSNSEVEIVYGDVVFIDEKKRIIGLKKGKKNLSIKDFKNDNALVQPEVFIKATVLNKIGDFDESFAYANDYEFWLRALKNNIKFLYIPEKFVYFRKRTDARSSGIYPKIIWETLLIQCKYFNLPKTLLKNIEEYILCHSEKPYISPQESFNIIKKDLLQDVNGILLIKRNIRKVKGYVYIKEAIIFSFRNKKYAIKFFLNAVSYYPLIIFSKNGIIFFVRMFFQREKIYYRVKNLLWDKLLRNIGF